jgi:hypothetical protein
MARRKRTKTSNEKDNYFVFETYLRLPNIMIVLKKRFL